jgi:hypothetical protein
MKAFGEVYFRKIVFLFLKIFYFWITVTILLFLATSQSGAIFSPKVHLLVYAFSDAVIAFLLAWIFIRAERKSLADYKLFWQRDALLKFFKGIAIGVASFLAIVLVLVLFANLEIIFFSSYCNIHFIQINFICSLMKTIYKLFKAISDFS